MCARTATRLGPCSHCIQNSSQLSAAPLSTLARSHPADLGPGARQPHIPGPTPARPKPHPALPHSWPKRCASPREHSPHHPRPARTVTTAGRPGARSTPCSQLHRSAGSGYPPLPPSQAAEPPLLPPAPPPPPPSPPPVSTEHAPCCTPAHAPPCRGTDVSEHPQLNERPRHAVTPPSLPPSPGPLRARRSSRRPPPAACTSA